MKTRIITFILVFGIVAVGIWVFSGYFMKDKDAPVTRIAPPDQTTPLPEPKPATVSPEPAIKPEPEKPAVVEPKPDVPTPVVKPEPKPEEQKPSTPSELKGKGGAQKLAQKLGVCLQTQHGESQNFLKQIEQLGLITQQDATILKAWQGSQNLTQVEPVGTFVKDGQKITRYRFVGADGKDLLVDMQEPSSAQEGWKVVAVREVGGKDQDATDASDSMQVAESFINAVRGGDMNRARATASGKQISDATIAGLCMVFEESGYKLRQSNPIRANFQNESSAGYLIYLESTKEGKSALVGLELKHDAGKNAWHVSAVSLDSLLEAYEKSGGDEGGRYFPIVKNPQGGDSLALFFAFDDSQLTPRSLRQLGIVAGMLLNSERKLDISGHTDDVGGEGYNKKLSERRAQATKAALIGMGVKPEQITTKGLGKSQPRRTYVMSDDEQAIDNIRAENRRAEIYLDFQ